MAQPGDVNNSGNVTANDALIIINELGSRRYSDPATRLLVDPAVSIRGRTFTTIKTATGKYRRSTRSA